MPLGLTLKAVIRATLTLGCLLILSLQSVVAAANNTDQETAQDSTNSDSASAITTTAIVNATLFDMVSAEPVSNAVILIEGKHISAVGGKDLEIPDSAEVIDGTGLVVTPGFIDSASKLWLTNASANASATDASLSVTDGIDHFSEDWLSVAAQGVTAVYLQPSNSGTTGGFGAVVSVVPDESSQPEVIAIDVALQAALGIGAANNQTRNQQLGRIKKLLGDVKKYKDEWDAYKKYLDEKARKSKKEEKADSEEGKTEPSPGAARGPDGSRRRRVSCAGRRTRGGRPTGRPTGRSAPPQIQTKTTSENGDAGETKSESDDEKDVEEKPPKKPDKDPLKERLVRVLVGEVPLRMELHGADDFHYLQQLQEEFEDIRFVFSGLTSLGGAAAELKSGNAPVVLGPWLETESTYVAEPDSVDSWATHFSNYEGTMVIATNGASSRSSRLLRSHMEKAVATGVDPMDALRGVTVNAARVLGVHEQLGTIEAGKRADLVAFHGHPLETRSRIGWVMSAGRLHTPDKHVAQEDSNSPKFENTTSIDKAWGQLPPAFRLTSQKCLLPDGSIKPATLVIRDGVIQLIESDHASHSAVEVAGPLFDVGDCLITPGLHSAYSRLGLSFAVDPASLPDSSYVVAGDAIVAGFPKEMEYLRSGWLRANLAPGDSNPLSGNASVVRFGAKTVVLMDEAFPQFSLVANARTPDSFPSSLVGQVKFIDRAFESGVLETRLNLPESIANKLAGKRQAIMESVTSGAKTALIVAETEAEIRAALDLVERRGIKSLLVGPREFGDHITRMVALGVGIAASPVQAADYPWYAADLAKASNAGVPVYFAGESAEQLRLTAGLMIQAGASEKDVLSKLCSGPELGNGLAQGLTTGAAADLVVWSGNPLALSAKPLLVIVDGDSVGFDD